MFDINKKGKLTKYEEHVRYHGNTLESSYQRQRYGSSRIETYIKQLFIVVDLKLRKSTAGLDFALTNNRVIKILKSYLPEEEPSQTPYGETICLKTISRGWKTLEELGLIDVKCVKKSDWVDPLIYEPRRRIIPNMKVIKKLLNVYDERDSFLNKYAYERAAEVVSNDKNVPEGQTADKIVELATVFLKRLIKIIRKRPYSYVEKVNEKYDQYSSLGYAKGRYKTASEMFIHFVKHVSSRYYNTGKMFHKYLPDHLKHPQVLIDQSVKLGEPFGELNIRDIRILEQMDPPEAFKYVNSIKGYKVPKALHRAADNLLIDVSSDGFVQGYNYHFTDYTLDSDSNTLKKKKYTPYVSEGFKSL